MPLGTMYCTPQKVREANELLQDETVFSDEEILPWIEKAQSRIDAALKKRYVVPLAEPVPAIIESIAQDMAAGFVIANTFSNQLSQEVLNLSNQLLKRADSDLARVVEERQLDDLPGIRLATTPGASSTSAMASTTPKPSPLEGILKQW
ncbi:MAG: phage protein Gp36 family protein [Bacillota bacterium]